MTARSGHGGPSGRYWSCAVCTLDNGRLAAKCAACGAKRVPEPGPLLADRDPRTKRAMAAAEARRFAIEQRARRPVVARHGDCQWVPAAAPSQSLTRVPSVAPSALSTGPQRAAIIGPQVRPAAPASAASWDDGGGGRRVRRPKLIGPLPRPPRTSSERSCRSPPLLGARSAAVVAVETENARLRAALAQAQALAQPRVCFI